MLENIATCIHRYGEWFNREMTVRDIGDAIEITVPLLDRHNDCLQVYARQDGDSLVLTDDGHTIGDLEMSGVELRSEGRAEALQLALSGFEVERNGETLSVKACAEDALVRLNDLLQAMLAVDALHVMATS